MYSDTYISMLSKGQPHSGVLHTDCGGKKLVLESLSVWQWCADSWNKLRKYLIHTFHFKKLCKLLHETACTLINIRTSNIIVDSNHLFSTQIFKRKGIKFEAQTWGWVLTNGKLVTAGPELKYKVFQLHVYKGATYSFYFLLYYVEDGGGMSGNLGH